MGTIKRYLASFGWDIALYILRALSGIITPMLSNKASEFIKAHITKLDKLVSGKINNIK